MRKARKARTARKAEEAEKQQKAEEKQALLSEISIEDHMKMYEEKGIILKAITLKRIAEIMKDALERVVALGTGRNCYIEGFRVGGKTGTAQISKDGSYIDNAYILSFMGIAPMNDPEIVCYLAIDNPKGVTQYGGTVSAPIAKNIMKNIFTFYTITASFSAYQSTIFITKRTSKTVHFKHNNKIFITYKGIHFIYTFF